MLANVGRIGKKVLIKKRKFEHWYRGISIRMQIEVREKNFSSHFHTERRLPTNTRYAVRGRRLSAGVYECMEKPVMKIHEN